MGARREVAAVVRAVARLVLPVECAGCGRADVTLCRRCATAWRQVGRAEHLAPHLEGAVPVWALAPYAGEARHAVLAWKSGGRPDLAAPLTTALRVAAAAVAGDVPAGPLLVLPAPSGAARRRAGRFVVGELADAAGAGLAGARRDSVHVVDVLRRRGGDAHLLSAGDRRADRAGAVRSTAPLPPRARCVLVDDVLTTGATLAACRAAVEASGGAVVAALVLAVTPPPGAVVQTSTVRGELLRAVRPLD